MLKPIENKRRVVITGIGPASSHGTGKDEFWKNVLSGKLMSEKITIKYKQYHN